MSVSRAVSFFYETEFKIESVMVFIFVGKTVNFCFKVYFFGYELKTHIKFNCGSVALIKIAHGLTYMYIGTLGIAASRFLTFMVNYPLKIR